MTTNRKILTLGSDDYGFPIIPQKLRDLEQMRRDEEVERKARAEARAERAKWKAEVREARREAAERRQQWEEHRYQRELERLHLQWEARVAARERAAEREHARLAVIQAIHDAEMQRRRGIWEQSLSRINERYHINLEDFHSEEPMWERVGREYEYKGRYWLGAGLKRRLAARTMAVHLGQWCKYPFWCGRGPYPPQKQPRGWKAKLPRVWSRRKHVECKWRGSFDPGSDERA